MLSNILKWAIVSLMLIGFIHYFYNYFMNTLTKPKIINLKKTEQKNEVIKEEKNEPIRLVTTELKINEEPQSSSQSAVMENELSAFLNNELKKD